MSLLPQRKKSAEEINRLRENLGIRGTAAPAPATHRPTAAPAAPSPVEREAAGLRGGADANARPGTRPVRSLRKSEQAPPGTPHPESPPDSKLPHQRHNPQEIEEIRRREVLAMMNAAPNPRLLPAHPVLLAPGYLLPPGAAAGIWFYQIPAAATAGAALLSLAIAGVILLRRPVSRHHAAFIAMLAVFLLVFSALYYFPQLRHAT